MIIVTVQRGCDQLVGILLIGWRCGKWESESPTLWSGVSVFVSSILLISPTW